MELQTIEIKPPTFVSERLSKALAHPLRVRILDRLNLEAMSVLQFVEAFPQYTHSQIYGHFRKLAKYDCIELVEMKTGGRRRGGKEKFYRATAKSVFDESSWASLPESLRTKITGAVFSTYIDRVSEALRTGTIDIRSDRHFTWSDPHFDQQAWDETIDEVESLFHRIPIRKAEAAGRLAETGEEPIPVTIALACFESPKASAPPGAPPQSP